MRRKALFYVLLGLATVGLSQFLRAWRQWRLAPSVPGGAEVALVGCGLLAAMLWLGFLLYEVDRAAGRVRHRVGLYEWVLARRDVPAHAVGPEARRPDMLAAGRWAETAPPGHRGAGER